MTHIFSNWRVRKPVDSEAKPDTNFIHWIEKVEKWNSDIANYPKNMFFYLHSFQLAARHYKIGHVCKRRSTSLAYSPFT